VSESYEELNYFFLAYFQRMEVSLSNHQVCLSACLFRTNIFSTAWQNFMKFGTELTPFKGDLYAVMFNPIISTTLTCEG
jgi:hypothetical protein